MESLFILSERQIEEINPFELPFVAFCDRKRLPNIPAVYFLIYGSLVHYVGQSTALVMRWSSHGLVARVSELGWVESEIKIAYLHCPLTWLDALESRLIDRFTPTLNSSFPKINALPEIECHLTELESEAASYNKLLKKMEATIYDVRVLKGKVYQAAEEIEKEIAALESISRGAEEVGKNLAEGLQQSPRRIRDKVLGYLMEMGALDAQKQKEAIEETLKPVFDLVERTHKQANEEFLAKAIAARADSVDLAAEAFADFARRVGLTAEDWNQAVRDAQQKAANKPKEPS
jgi:predicted  nucleic acid-binding Zn-ribbon protein